MFNKAFQKSGLRFLCISLLVFIMDWATKQLALLHLDLYSPVAVFPSFNLTLAYNTGAAFSLLDQASPWSNALFSGVAIAVSIGILCWLYKLPQKQRISGVALTLILGGALGNLWDRLHYGHVIDFIDLYVSTWHWPVFNVADAAVCIGAILIIWQWKEIT